MQVDLVLIFLRFPWHLLKPLITYKLERVSYLMPCNIFPTKTCIIVMVLLFLLLQVMEDFFENNPTDRAYTSEVISKSRDLYPDTQKLISSLNRFTG